jgi:hypothetical protein
MLELAGHPQLPSVRLHATSWTSKLLHAKNDLALGPSGVRAGPKARSAHMPSGAVLMLKNGALLLLGISGKVSRSRMESQEFSV